MKQWPAVSICQTSVVSIIVYRTVIHSNLKPPRIGRKIFRCLPSRVLATALLIVQLAVVNSII